MTTTASTLTTADLRPGMTVRRFRNSDPITVASVTPANRDQSAAIITDTDGSTTTIGSGATWHLA